MYSQTPFIKFKGKDRLENTLVTLVFVKGKKKKNLTYKLTKRKTFGFIRS